MCCPSIDPPRPVIVRVSGSRSNVGKTTLIERLIPIFSQRGFRVGTIKHTHHGFDLDYPGKDSDRHRIAGATATVLIGPTSSAVLLHDQPRIELDAAVAQLSGHVDLILAEGFRSAAGFAIHLDPELNDRARWTDTSITLGVMPDELNNDEIVQIADACLAHQLPQ